MKLAIGTSGKSAVVPNATTSGCLFRIRHADDINKTRNRYFRQIRRRPESDNVRLPPPNIHPAEVEHDRVKPLVEIACRLELANLLHRLFKGAKYKLLRIQIVPAHECRGGQKTVAVLGDHPFRPALGITPDEIPDVHSQC